MLFRIVAFEARPQYRLWVRFEDGVEGEVDLSDMVGKGVFSRWENAREFAQVFIDAESGAPVWPGELDVAPDALYHELAGTTSR